MLSCVAGTPSCRIAAALGSFRSPPVVREQVLIQYVRSSPKLLETVDMSYLVMVGRGFGIARRRRKREV